MTKPAVFFYQSFLHDQKFHAELASGGPRLEFKKISTPDEIASWEKAMRHEVGMKGDIKLAGGVGSTSGCIGNGSDDCDQWS